MQDLASLMKIRIGLELDCYFVSYQWLDLVWKLQLAQSDDLLRRLSTV